MARPTPAEAIRLLPRDAYLFDPASHALLDEVLAAGRLPRSGAWRWRILLAIMIAAGVVLTLAVTARIADPAGPVFAGTILDRLVEESADGVTYVVVYTYATADQIITDRTAVSEDQYQRFSPGTLVEVTILDWGPPAHTLLSARPLSPAIDTMAAMALVWWGATLLLGIYTWRMTRSPHETLLEGEITRARLRRDEVDPDAHLVVIAYDFLTPDGERALSGEDAFFLAPGSEMPAAGMPVIVRYRGPRRYHLL